MTPKLGGEQYTFIYLTVSVVRNLGTALDRPSFSGSLSRATVTELDDCWLSFCLRLLEPRPHLSRPCQKGFSSRRPQYGGRLHQGQLTGRVRETEVRVSCGLPSKVAPQLSVLCSQDTSHQVPARPHFHRQAHGPLN